MEVWAPGPELRWWTAQGEAPAIWDPSPLGLPGAALQTGRRPGSARLREQRSPPRQVLNSRTRSPPFWAPRLGRPGRQWDRPAPGECPRPDKGFPRQVSTRHSCRWGSPAGGSSFLGGPDLEHLPQDPLGAGPSLPSASTSRSEPRGLRVARWDTSPAFDLVTWSQRWPGPRPPATG